MISHKDSRPSTIVARLRRIWSELDYANRRMFEIRTGQPFVNDRDKIAPSGRAAGRRAVPAR